MNNQYRTTNLIKQEIFTALWEKVGHTPMIEVSYRYFGGPVCKILVKCEQNNLTGSTKDRLALYILQKAYHLGTIRSGDLIVEAGSGNAEIALAVIGRALGHRVRLFIPDRLDREKTDSLRSQGVELRLVSQAEGGAAASIRLAEREIRKGDVFLPRQFGQFYQAQVHERTTGREIWRQLQQVRVMPRAFVAGVGTGGTIVGIGTHLKSVYPAISIHPLQPLGDRIPGLTAGPVPKLVQLNVLDEVIRVADGDAILMAQALGRILGLAVGVSSGANFLGAVQLQQASGSENAVVTIFPDNNRRYIRAGLFQPEPALPGYLAPGIELLEYKTLPDG